MATLPAVPSIPNSVDPQLWTVLNAIKTNIEYLQTNPATSSGASVNQAQLEAAVANAVTGITTGSTGATGSPGTPGSNGINGKIYILDITGGRTSIIYDATGASPLPTMTAFGADLYEDGVLITSGITYSWLVPSTGSMLSGSSTASTFTPTVASTFDATKSNNVVQLIASYAGLSMRANEPVAITKIGATGSTGATGATGPTGTAGTPGAAGSNTYFHVAYADSSNGSVNFNQTSGSYIGTYVDTNPTDSGSYTAYNWVLIKGSQGATGTQGIPGTNGSNGQTSYLHIKYSNDNGVTFTASAGETPGAYLGVYVDFNITDSSTITDYTWSLIKGSDGVNGTRTAVMDMYKMSATAPSTFPSGSSTYDWTTGQFTAPGTTNGWSLTPPAAVTGQTLWIARTTYADTNATSSTSIAWTATTANPLSASGADGANGTRTATMDMYKWSATTPSTFPSGTSTYTWSNGTFTAPGTVNGWSLTPPSVVQGQTLWMARTTYADNNNTSTTSITWTATTAKPLAFAGTDGTGASSYLHIKYSNDNGTTFTASGGATPGDYIGTYSDGSPTDSSSVGAYTWALIKGVDGRRTAVIELYQWASATPTTFPVGTSTYTWATGAFTLPGTTNGWALTPGAVTPGQTLYACSVVYSDTQNSGTTDITWTATSAYAVGFSGSNGLNTAIVYAYQKSSSPLSSNPGDVVYTFASKTITNPAPDALANGWTKTIPASGGNTLYVTAATASSSASTDAISAAEWSSPVAISADGTNGANGSPGADGLNVSTAILYQRTTTNSAPSAVANTATFIFATGAITGTLGSWTAAIPDASGGRYLWVTRATASANGATDTIASGEWSIPALYVKDGASYALFITGGKTNAVYDTTGANPLPAQTAFSAELYQDGTLVTPASFSWSVPATNSLLSGSSSTSTFTPTLASAYDVTKGDNRVLLTCTYAGQTLKAVQPIAITQLVAGTSDTSTPAALDNLTVTGGILYNLLTWEVPSGYPIPGNIDHVNIYRAATDDRTIATVVGTSKYAIAKDFIPEGVGTNYYYWIRAVSKSDIEGDWNLVSGVVSSAGTSAAPLGIGDSQVSSISAAKIIAASLSALTANLGEVTAGVIRSADSTFIIDLADKSITIAGVGGVVSDDYTIFKNGQIQVWKKTPSGHQQGSSLQTIEGGTIGNGVSKTLDKWYASIPNIIVTPNDTPVYNAAYSGQSQKLQVRAENVAITAGGTVSFTAVSRLVLSGANPLTPVNETSGASYATNTWTTTPITSAANTNKIDVNVSFSSKRGTGTSPNYYYRKVQARIGWRTSGSTGAYTYSGYTTVNMIADFATYTTSLTSGAITTGTWQFIVEYIASDKDGTQFASGSTAYDELPGGFTDVALAANSALFSASSSNASPLNNVTASISLPAFSPGAYTVYQVDWTVTYGYYTQATGGSFGTAGYIHNNISGANLFVSSGTASAGTLNVPAALTSMTYTQGSYSAAQSPLNCNTQVDSSTPSSAAKAQVKIFASGTFARIRARKPQANVTTPSNQFTLVSYALTLSSATVIDGTGTLNYLVIA